MRIIYPTTPSAAKRFFLISAIVLAAIIGFAELSELLIATDSTVVKAKGGSASASNSTLTYQWNVDDAGLPLLNLPDHIRGAVDLSITYSMDQFQFPLLQSLYFNERLGKYILMVVSKDRARVEFVDLARVKGRQFEAKGDLSLRLEDKGYAKLLITGEGTVYTFATVGNEEFHCSQIRDRNGLVINLKYKNDASIDTIADASGRTISFGYENDYLTSITQTWGPAATKKQTWAIAEDEIRSTPAVNLTATGAEMVKHIPSNAL